MAWFDRVPWWLALTAAFTIGLVPYAPEPHLWEKLKMLVGGSLVKPIDIFDLALHGTPWLIVLSKLYRSAKA